MSSSGTAAARQQRRNLLAQSQLNLSSKRGDIRKARQKEALAIEKDARDHLNRVLLEIAAQHSNDISVIQRNYYQEVQDIIRAAANNAYITGINYVANLKNVNHRTFITNPDLQTIKHLTAEFEQVFWRRVAAVLHQKDVISSILSARFSTKSKLSLTSIVTGFVTRMVTKAIAVATIAKHKVFTFKNMRPTKSAAIETDFVWTTEEDERVCPLCQSLDGEQWSQNDPDMPIPGDDTHDNCVLGDTMVCAPEILAALRTSYNGPIIQITISTGDTIAVTPNHMFLTTHGFASADLLMEGDDIIYCGSFDSSAIGPNENWKPVRADEVFESLSKNSLMPTASVPVTPEDLHGDARFSNSNIDVVTATGLLHHNLTIGNRSSQAVSAVKLDSAGVVLPLPFSELGHMAPFLKAAAFASDRCMSSVRKPSSFFCGRVRHTQVHRLTSPALDNAATIESSYYNVPADTKMLSHLLDRHAGIIQRKNIIKIDVNPCWSGFVYDFQTRSTVYVGNGIILSNCRCRLDVVGPGGEDTGIEGDTGDTTATDIGAAAGLASTTLGLGLTSTALGQEDCPEGLIWAEKKGKCQECQPDEHTDAKTGDCVPDNCPKNMHWDDDSQTCVDDT